MSANQRTILLYRFFLNVKGNFSERIENREKCASLKWNLEKRGTSGWEEQESGGGF